jgi:hypothetical protein
MVESALLEAAFERRKTPPAASITRIPARKYAAERFREILAAHGLRLFATIGPERTTALTLGYLARNSLMTTSPGLRTNQHPDAIRLQAPAPIQGLKLVPVVSARASAARQRRQEIFPAIDKALETEVIAIVRLQSSGIDVTLFQSLHHC